MEQATLLPIPGRTWATFPAPRDPHDEVCVCHARSDCHERTRLPICGADPGVHRDEKRRVVILSEEASHRCIEGCSRRSDGWEHGFDRSFPGQASRAHFRIGLRRNNDMICANLLQLRHRPDLCHATSNRCRKHFPQHYSQIRFHSPHAPKRPQ
jgi:hypothetical protein